VEPADLSQQHEFQLEEPYKVLYVEGGRLSTFLLDVSNSNPHCAVAPCTLDIWVHPAARLETVRA